MVEDLTVTLLCQVLSKSLGKELGANEGLCFSASDDFLEEVEANGVNLGQVSGLLLVAEMEDAFVLPDQSSKTCIFPSPANAKSLLEFTMDACGLRT